MQGFHYSSSYSWAWKLFPFGTQQATFACMKPQFVRKKMQVDELLRAAGDNAGGCGHRYMLETGGRSSCWGSWCHNFLAGSIDRGAAHVAQLWPTLPSLGNASDSSVFPLNLTHPAEVVWHVRTGDIYVTLQQSAVTTIARNVERGFSRRGLRHTVVTYESARLQKECPWLLGLLLQTSAHKVRVLDKKSTAEQAAFVLMYRAQVLISTGSSFPQAAGFITPAGRQIHFYFPPKNSGEAEANATEVLTASFLRSTAVYRAFFVRKNTIPVDVSGRPFPEYGWKMREMMRSLDTHGAADPDVANLHYEAWL